MEKQMRNIMLTMALAMAGLVAGCGNGAKFDASFLAPVIGDQGVHALNAGGHLLNAASLGEKDEDALGQSVGVSLTNRYSLASNTDLQQYND